MANGTIHFDTWLDIKTLIDKKYRYYINEIDTNRYIISIIINDVRYNYILPKETPVSADQSDLETNYLTGSETTLANAINVYNTRYSPRFYESTTKVDVSGSSETELWNQDFCGKLDAISVAFDDEAVDFILEIDGVRILDINLDELDSTSRHDLELDSDETVNGFPIAVRNNGEHIIIAWRTPVDVQSNVTIKAQGNDGSLDMENILISYRIQI